MSLVDSSKKRLLPGLSDDPQRQGAKLAERLGNTVAIDLPMSSGLCVYTPGTLNKMNDMVRFIIATDITLEVGWVLPMTEALGAVPDMFKGRALVRAFSDGYDGRLRVVILAGPVSFAGRGCRDDKMTHIKIIGAQYQ